MPKPVGRVRRREASAIAITAAAVLAAMLSPVAAAQTPKWPTRPISLVVGSAPGGSNDTFARALAKPLQEALGQSVVVENRPAGGGIIANTVVAQAPPDGYHFVVLSSTFTTGAAIRSNLQYDPIKSFRPVAMLAKGPLLVTVAADSPFKSIEALVSAARAEPGKLNYGTSGPGSINQFATELFAGAADIKLTPVPYKGMGPATNDLIAGQIQLLVASAPSILGQVKGGRVRALAVTTATRSPVAPDLPSLEQSGYKGSASELWWGVLTAAATPQPIIDRMNGEINRIIQSEQMKDFLLREGAEAAPMKPEQFAAFIAAEIDRWKSVAESAGIKPE